ncbi:ribokinase [Pontibacter diazotrophicus]|uniref:Ribokinase n=1 Tax=Pontibacter diazotrophicus TaxID=1400979 RepID=A0A3D8LIE1_9BACT|nr:ribokinase [Pontibacter diazotrophicus]RDV17210.1 ribokinase [Pontibacter diazotrophicus]
MSETSRICVIGSSNTDMVVKSERLPSPGETVLGGRFLMNPGGKGANQAVAASRLGGQVSFITKVGSDVFGRQALQQFQRERIDTRHVVTDAEQPSGVALINVDATGENCIAVAPGSNNHLLAVEVEAGLPAAGSNALVLLQLEIPLGTVAYAVRESHVRGLRVILNPAPAQELPQDLYPCLYVITPNETEAELLTGVRVIDLNTAAEASRRLLEKGVSNVVITLGSRGAYLYSGADAAQLIPAPPVTPVDTTAAGDCFNGALTVALSEGLSLEEAVAFACKAASISVTRMGAQSSLPHRRELESLPLVGLV